MSKLKVILMHLVGVLLFLVQKIYATLFQCIPRSDVPYLSLTTLIIIKQLLVQNKVFDGSITFVELALRRSKFLFLV